MKPTRLQVLILPFLILVLGTAACGKITKKKGLPGPDDKVYDVVLGEVQSREVPDSTEFKGAFHPVNELELKSDFSGRVQTLSAVEGQVVVQGDVLLKIEDEKLPYVLDRQRAELREAEIQLEMDTRAATGGGLPEEVPFEEEPEYAEEEPAQPFSPIQPVEPVEGAEEEGPTPEPAGREEEGTELTPVQRALLQRQRQARRLVQPAPPPQAAANGEMAENRIALSQARVDRIRAEIAFTERQLAGSTLLAPFDAFVSKVAVAEGSMVQPNDPLMALVTLDPIELSL
ncbi:MAG: biotin/lipoyl-binding protein, partial [bacterium]